MSRSRDISKAQVEQNLFLQQLMDKQLLILMIQVQRYHICW